MPRKELSNACGQNLKLFSCSVTPKKADSRLHGNSLRDRARSLLMAVSQGPASQANDLTLLDRSGLQNRVGLTVLMS